MEYQQKFDRTAYEVLSKPFRTRKHVCREIGITDETYEQWKTEHRTFRLAIKHGFLTGEANARNQLQRLSVLPTNRINTKLFLTMAEDVYGIGLATDDEVIPDSEKEWKITIVKPKAKEDARAESA